MEIGKYDDFKNKKVLVFGLGLLGGGLATTNWLLRQGARVTVTDLKTKEQLAPTLKKIKGSVALRLGGHDEADIRNNDIIVCNPDISVNNPYIALARTLRKRIENEATIFYEHCDKPIIAITGTRGKTTTTTWTQHFLGRTAVLAGNRYDNALLDVLPKLPRYRAVVNEIPSFHLEYFSLAKRRPHIAVITNLSRDHINRHGTMKGYATAKANVFMNQTRDDLLILNRDDDWTKFFLQQKPKANIWFFSLRPLVKRERGLFVRDGKIYFQDAESAHAVFRAPRFAETYGEHNVKNLLAAALAAHLAGASWRDVAARTKTLPAVEFRQEIIFKSPQLTIVNDTTATSPDGGIAAVERFAPLPAARSRASDRGACVLIAGGTDRGLEYADWAKVVRARIAPDALILLSGSATDKILAALGSSYQKHVLVFDSLRECLDAALKKAKSRKAVIVFSPAAKSFEKFQNEYDRGKQFNRLVAQMCGRKGGRRG